MPGKWLLSGVPVSNETAEDKRKSTLVVGRAQPARACDSRGGGRGSVCDHGIFLLGDVLGVTLAFVANQAMPASAQFWGFCWAVQAAWDPVGGSW